MPADSTMPLHNVSIEHNTEPFGLDASEYSPSGQSSLGAMSETAVPGSEIRPAPAQNLSRALTALIDAVNCSLSGDRQHALKYLRIASNELAPEPIFAETGAPGGNPEASRVSCCGLAPWQVRLISNHIEQHLSESVLCEDMSRLVCLSVSHFMRKFRESFGCPPHSYLMRRRMERAQGLMLSTDTSLGEISLECGMTDQAHFTRLFQKFTGESPAAWRRARRSVTAKCQAPGKKRVAGK